MKIEENLNVVVEARLALVPQSPSASLTIVVSLSTLSLVLLTLCLFLPLISPEEV